jgi:hypothetical protein
LIIRAFHILGLELGYRIFGIYSYEFSYDNLDIDFAVLSFHMLDKSGQERIWRILLTERDESEIVAEKLLGIESKLLSLVCCIHPGALTPSTDLDQLYS